MWFLQSKKDRKFGIWGLPKQQINTKLNPNPILTTIVRKNDFSGGYNFTVHSKWQDHHKSKAPLTTGNLSRIVCGNMLLKCTF